MLCLFREVQKAVAHWPREGGSKDLTQFIKYGVLTSKNPIAWFDPQFGQGTLNIHSVSTIASRDVRWHAIAQSSRIHQPVRGKTNALLLAYAWESCP